MEIYEYEYSYSTCEFYSLANFICSHHSDYLQSLAHVGHVKFPRDMTPRHGRPLVRPGTEALLSI